MFNVGSAQGYLKLNTTGWATSMRGANASLTSLSRSFSRMGMVAVGSLTLITREFGKFDKAIRHATSVSETTTAQFDEMSRMALDASVRWNKAATSTAQAFYFLGSAGLTVTEQMQAFNDTIMLSRAMGSELAQTTEGLVDIIRAFNLSFDDTRHIGDMLTKTVISSNQNFVDLEQALAYASSTASWTNNTLAETAAMLGVMANAGIKGSMAGTVLRRAMTNLAAPTRAMTELMHELSLNIYDADGKTKPFIETLANISDALRGTSEEYRNMVFETLFGRRAIAGQIKLFDYTAESLRKYGKEIMEAHGIMEKVAGKQMKAFTEQMGRLRQQVRRVAIVLGEKLAPSIQAVADKMRDHVKAFEDYIEKNDLAITSTLKWMAVIGAVALVLPILLNMTAALVSLISPFTVLVGALYLYRAVWLDTFEKGGVLNKSLDEFGTILKAWADKHMGIFDEMLLFPFRMLKRSGEGYGMIGAEIWKEIQREKKKAMQLRPELKEVWRNKLGQFPKKAPIPIPFSAVVTKGKEAATELSKIAADRAKQDMDILLAGIEKILPVDLKATRDEILALFDAFMNTVVNITVKTEEEVGNVLNALEEEILEVDKVLRTAAAGWGAALDAVFQPKETELEKWSYKFITVLDGIQSAWSSTFTGILNDTYDKARTIENVLDDMFTGILRSFNALVSELLAQDLLYAMLGRESKLGKWKEGMPSILWGEGGIIEKFKGVKDSITGTTPLVGDFPMEPMAKAAIPSVVINNNTGERMSASKPAFNGKEYVVNVVMEEYNTNPNFRNALRE